MFVCDRPENRSVGAFRGPVRLHTLVCKCKDWGGKHRRKSSTSREYDSSAGWRKRQNERERERQREIERDREREGERANTQGSGTTSYQGRDLLQQFEFLELKASIQLAVSCFEQGFAAPACQTSTYENLRVAFHGAGEPVPRGISAPSFFLSLSQCFAPPPAASQRQTAETKS